MYDLQQALLGEIEKRFSGIEFLRPYAAATILDPRYKKFVFESPRAVALIVGHISKFSALGAVHKIGHAFIFHS